MSLLTSWSSPGAIFVVVSTADLSLHRSLMQVWLKILYLYFIGDFAGAGSDC